MAPQVGAQPQVGPFDAVIFSALTLADAGLPQLMIDQVDASGAKYSWFAAQVAGPGVSLIRRLNELAAAGNRRVLLVGVVAKPGPQPLSWLRRIAGEFVRNNAAVSVAVSSELVRVSEITDPDIIAKMQQAVLAPYRLVTGSEAGLTNPEWEELPPYRYHLLICRGPRCNARGADESYQALMSELRNRDAVDTEVLVTSCMFPCNHAPVVAVYPDGIWRELPAKDVPQFVAQLLDDNLGAKPVTSVIDGEDID